jgi:hypothetical protein
MRIFRYVHCVLYLYSNDKKRSWEIGSLRELTAIAQFGERPGWDHLLRVRELGSSMLVELTDRVAASADTLDTLYLPGKLYEGADGFLEGTLENVAGDEVNLAPRWRAMCTKLATACAGEAMRGEGPVLIESSPTLS